MKAVKDILTVAYLAILIVSFLVTVVGFFYIGKITALWVTAFFVFIVSVNSLSFIFSQKGNGFNPYYD